MIRVEEFIKDEILYYSENFIQNPLVSVIMPTYCRGDNGLLKRAIDSVLGQTFKSFEFIIVDDGSVDGTQDLVKSYLKKDPRILYIRNDTNSGLPALRVNQGILHARGKYIAYQFDDDRWVKDALEALVEEIEKQEKLALVYGDWESYNVKEKNREVHKRDFRYYDLMAGNFIANNSVIHHKELFYKYGMYDCHLTMRRLCDWDLWLRFAKEIPFIHLNKNVSLIEIMVDNSLGDTVALDMHTARIFFGKDRNEALIPSKIMKYEIDNIDFIFNDELRVKIYNKHILPWKLKHIDLFHNINIYEPPLQKQKRVIVTKCDYDATVNIMIENFISLQSNVYQYIYIPEAQLQYENLFDGDILIFCRATTQNSLDIARRLKAENRSITMLYFIDDDLLNIYKLGKEFSYIAPGTAMYEIVCELLRISDRVVAFSSAIEKSIKKYNNNVSVLKTNVLLKYLGVEHSYDENGTFKIVFMGGGARKKEFESILDDLVRISEKYKERVSFTFLGYIPEKMKTVKHSTVTYMEYTSSYYQYMNYISQNRYNLMLCPLYDNDFTRGKSPIKLLEACCCSTIGLFSDVPVYDCIKDGVHGYKIKNGDSWFEKIDMIIQSPINVKKQIFSNAVSLVKRKFTTESNMPEFELTLKTAELASYIKKKAILYVCHSAYLAGAENHLFRHCLLARQAGFHVVFALPDYAQGQGLAMQKVAEKNGIDIIYLRYQNYCEIEEIDINSAIEMGKKILDDLGQLEIAIIHSSTLIPALGYVARTLKIPYVASLYATESDYICSNPNIYFNPDFVHSDSVLFANKWQDKIGCISRCIRSYIPQEFYQTRELYKKKVYRIAVSGTLQERKRQKELIEAIGLLKSEFDIELYLFGYDHFYPDYKNQCIEIARRYGIEDRIFFKGFVDNVHVKFNDYEIDILACASVFESFPQVILEAMAMEIPVVTTPVAGVPELILNKKTGFVSSGFTSKDLSIAIKDCIMHIEANTIKPIIQNAKMALIRECSFLNVSYQLFDVYMQSINICNKKYRNVLSYKVPDRLPENNYISNEIEKPSRSIETNVLVYSKELRGKRSYNILCEVNELSEIGVIFASEKSGTGGFVIMDLYANGRLLRRAELPIDKIVFNKWNYFRFNPIYGCGGKVLTVQLTFKYEESSAVLGVYEDKRNRSFIYKVFNKLGHPLKGLNTLYVDCRK